jgi:hydrogenase/urease accessory protein HupE
MTKRVAAIGLVWLALVSRAAAHPGHGHGGGDFSLTHYLTEPMHLSVAIPLLMLVALIATRVTRARSLRRG